MLGSVTWAGAPREGATWQQTKMSEQPKSQKLTSLIPKSLKPIFQSSGRYAWGEKAGSNRP